MADLDKLQEIIGVRFKKLALLELALVHSSYINENPALAPVSNERLEYLGDAVLGFAFAECLYAKYPSASEGDLTRYRSQMVRGTTLADAAVRLGLGDYLFLGRGEESGGGRQKKANLAGAVEALIAAIYLDRGMVAAKEFIFRLLSVEIGELGDQSKVTDYKSRLQEIVQARNMPTPSYDTVEENGPGNERHFAAEVLVGKKVLGRGTGKSKKLAEVDAAREAMNNLGIAFT